MKELIEDGESLARAVSQQEDKCGSNVSSFRRQPESSRKSLKVGDCDCQAGSTLPLAPAFVFLTSEQLEKLPCSATIQAHAAKVAGDLIWLHIKN